MKHYFKLIALAAAMPALAGCGHNMLSVFDGADASVEPSLNNGFSAHLRYGQIVQITMKEKAKATVAITQDQKSADGVSNGNKVEITFETADQTNGYVVELEKAKQSDGAKNK